MKEYELWLKQAEIDYDTASYNLEGKIYYASANYSQQAIEKALKALVIFKKGEIVKTHNITKIAKDCEMPRELIIKISIIEPIFKESKYPDISNKVPAEEYEEKDAIEFLNSAEEVIKWVKNQLK
jgi:HEPN domain-containing protein